MLVVDDDADMCRALVDGLARSGYRAQARSSAAAAFELLESGEFDAVVADVRMRGGGGLELCARVVESRPDVPVIVMTAFGSMETAIEAIRAGAYDFVTKPFGLEELRAAVRRATEHRALSKKVARLEQAVRAAHGFRSAVGACPEMRKVYELVERVAPSPATVLIAGESGTGKELVARALHDRSGRRGSFVAVNCAAVPEALLESELFGHTRGAFTDAKEEREGLFLQAAGGTLFLDEIAELPLGLQPKLLRALQERTVRPVGGAETPFDARLVAATNRDLEAAVEAGRFRADLYYRVQVIQIELPPLRARGNDVLELAQHFVRHFAARADRPVTGILPAAARRLLAYPWPGNVRELQNCIERAVTLCRHAEISAEDLPERISGYEQTQIVLAGDDPSALPTMEEVERRYVLRVFEACGGNKALAARTLGFDRKTLYRKLQRYGALGGGDDDADG